MKLSRIGEWAMSEFMSNFGVILLMIWSAVVGFAIAIMVLK